MAYDPSLEAVLSSPSDHTASQAVSSGRYPSQMPDRRARRLHPLAQSALVTSPKLKYTNTALKEQKDETITQCVAQETLSV